jgi:hypothetical protein
MKSNNTLLIIFLSTNIIQTIPSAHNSKDYGVYKQMSIENLRRRQTELIQQNIKRGYDWPKEKQVETYCGVCCSFFIPVVLCSCAGYQLNNNIGLPIGTLVGLKIGAKAVSAFASWYQPDYEDTMAELRSIQSVIITKQKEKVD